MRTRTVLRKSISGTIFDCFNATFMILFCISIFPFWDMIVLSFTPSDKVNTLSIKLWTDTWVIDSYKYILSDTKILTAMLVSIYRTVTGTLIHVVLVVFAAYPLSKTDIPYRKQMTIFFLIPMFFGGGLVPSYIINRYLGFVDNLLVYIIPGAFSVYVMIIVRNYFMTMDKAIEESATIDGASVLRILFSILIPLAKPVLATIALWQMVGQWNSWFDCLIYMRSEKKIVLQMILRRMLDNTSMMPEEIRQYAETQPGFIQFNSKTVQAATTMLVVLPIICVYPFLQKYFVKGIMLGGVKG